VRRDRWPGSASFLISVPMCQSVELFTAFFDAVADSVRWAAPNEIRMSEEQTGDSGLPIS